MPNLITPIGKASFPNLFKAKLNELSGKSEYSVDLLFDKKTDISSIKDSIAKVTKAKWGSKIPKVLKNPIKDGDGVKQNGEPYGTEYHNHFFITVKNTRKPGIVDSQAQPILTEEEVYGGCHVRASLNPFAYDHAANKGVSLSLVNLQKIKDGTPFGGEASVSAESEFDIVDEEVDNPDNYKEGSSLLG